jgi:hypothetical protein
MEVNQPFLNYQFTQTAYRNQAIQGSAIRNSELPVLSGLAALVKQRLRRRFDQQDEQICDALLEAPVAQRAKMDGHRERMKRAMKIMDEGDTFH